MLFFIHVIIVGNENLNKKKESKQIPKKKRTIHGLRVIFFFFWSSIG